MTHFLIRVGEGSSYADEARKGGFVAVGWNELSSLDEYSSLDKIREALGKTTKYTPAQLGQQAGQVARFALKMQEGDKILMPLGDGEFATGKVGAYYYEPSPKDGCPFQHRRKVEWSDKVLKKEDMSSSLAYGLGGIMTIYSIQKHAPEIEALMEGRTPTPGEKPLRVRDQVLEQLMELDGKEFEEFVMHLLTVIGLDAETTQYTNDKGIDVVGILDVEGLADITVRVQVKRLSSSIGRKVVQEIRGAICRDEHPCIITTSAFHKNAVEEAVDTGKVPVKLIDGHDLAAIVLRHFDDLDEKYQQLLAIRRRRMPLEDQFENADDVQEVPTTAGKNKESSVDITFDTIVCAAQEDGFKKAFLDQKAWWAVRIGDSRIPSIKYIAMYQVAPASAITYYGVVDRIEPYENAGKYKIFLKGDPIKLEEAVPLGMNRDLKPQGPKYTFIESITKAKTLDDLWDTL